MYRSATGFEPAQAPRRLGRRVVLSVVVALVGLTVTALIVPRATEGQARSCRHNTILNVVAHEDDDLLFMNPDISNALGRNRCVTTVYVTAGDNGRGPHFWSARERGVRAAYDALAARPKGSWTFSRRLFGGHTVATYALTGGRIRLMFLQLPDGRIAGTGFRRTHFETLKKLWLGKISRITTVTRSGSYSRAALITTLRAIVTSIWPTSVRTLNADGHFGDGDHSDHVAVGKFVTAAIGGIPIAQRPTLWTYYGYTIRTMPVDLTLAQTLDKKQIFSAYESTVNRWCRLLQTCARKFPAFTDRQYRS